MQIWADDGDHEPALMQPLDLPRKPLSMGMPVLGYECKVVDADGKDVPPGTVESWSSRHTRVTLMKGYFKNDGHGRDAARRWLQSGDQASHGRGRLLLLR